MKLNIRGLFPCALLFAGVLLTGCGSLATSGLPPAASQQAPRVARFRVGETVNVTFSGVPQPIDPHSEKISEEGTITLPLIGAVNAIGKTTGELQHEIYTNYVPKYYVRLTVTVKESGDDRFFYVAGEVHNPGRVYYLDGTTVTKAIQSAGDLTDFAKHSGVWLTHVGSSKRIRVDYDKAAKDPALDPPVYPDDVVNVDKSW